MKNILEKLPMASKLPKGAAAMMDDQMITQMEAIILSMTPKERRFPALLESSRKRRIATGSGTTLQDVGKLLKQFMQLQKMMRRLKGNKMANQMKQMEQMKDKLPKDFLGQFPDLFK